MAANQFDAERHIDAVAPATGLDITARQRPGVALFLTIAKSMADKVQAAPVPADELHLAPAYRPGRRDA